MRKKKSYPTHRGTKRKQGHADEKPLPLPAFCDFDCRHASFAAPEATGACRREQAVYCMLFSQYNNKNALCLGANARGSVASMPTSQ